MIIGFDTGFFVALSEENEEAINQWESLKQPGNYGVVSCLTIFELKRLALLGKVEEQVMKAIIKKIPIACRVVWLEDLPLIQQAARVSAGVGLSSIDALILTSLIEERAVKIYTTDRDFEKYNKKGIKIINLKRR